MAYSQRSRPSAKGPRGPRINQAIRAPKVRVVNKDRSTSSILSRSEALNLAKEAGLDLIEIAPKAQPPVCILTELSKWKYEQKRARKAKASKAPALKEIKLSPNIGEGDLQHKLQHMREFLNENHPLKITLLFKGRERAHPDLGMQLVQSVVEQLKDIGKVSAPPRLQGRAITAMLTPAG